MKLLLNVLGWEGGWVSVLTERLSHMESSAFRESSRENYFFLHFQGEGTTREAVLQRSVAVESDYTEKDSKCEREGR